MTPRTKPGIIYSDGACSGKLGRGMGRGILIYGEHAAEISGGSRLHHNRMETRAATEAAHRFETRPSRAAFAHG